MVMNQSYLLTVKEAAKYLRLKESTIYHYVHKNRISFYKIGSRVLFKRDDLDLYIENNYFPERK